MSLRGSGEVLAKARIQVQGYGGDKFGKETGRLESPCFAVAALRPRDLVVQRHGFDRVKRSLRVAESW